jgi:hypothetical protein
VLVLVLVAAVVSLAGTVAAYIAVRGAARVAAPAARPTNVAAKPATPTPTPPRPKAADKPAEVRYPLRSLLGINGAVDIDGSREHLLGLFPSVASSRVADQLRYVIPLAHPWFGAAELSWKNERAGKLSSVALRPPAGHGKLENQKEIADCLGKGLGKPEVREIDHLAGDVSYFWGRHFPRAWANLYSGYFWLTFRDPKGVAPITFTQVLRTLDGCGARAP